MIPQSCPCNLHSITGGQARGEESGSHPRIRVSGRMWPGWRNFREPFTIDERYGGAVILAVANCHSFKMEDKR